MNGIMSNNMFCKSEYRFEISTLAEQICDDETDRNDESDPP